MSVAITVSVLSVLTISRVRAGSGRIIKKHRDTAQETYLLGVRYEAAIDATRLLYQWYNLTLRGPEEDPLVKEVLEVLSELDAEALRMRAITDENRREPGSWTLTDLKRFAREEGH